MMGFQVVPQDAKTFKISVALNADFDGDEINCHVPQNSMTTTEVKELITTPFNVLSPKNGMSIICIVQDAMVSMYLLARRKKQIKRSMFMQSLVEIDDLSRFNEIARWIINKSSLGSSSSSLTKCIFDNYGAERAAQFIHECQFLADRYMLYTGYSLGINDYMVIPRKVVKSIVDNDFLKADPLEPDVAVENVKKKIMNMSRQQLNQDDNNGFMINVESGAKGTLFNACQMTGLLGQQYINGKRLTDDMPQGTIFDQGFIVASFGSGLTPREFFNHARAGRTSLCDTALRTSDIILEYDAIFDDPYATNIGETFIRELPIPYTKVTSIHYQALSKKDIVWKIDVNNLLFGHYEVYC